MTRRRVDWITLDDGQDSLEHPLATCERCGGVLARPALPMPLNDFLALLSAFAREHGECPPKGPTP